MRFELLPRSSYMTKCAMYTPLLELSQDEFTQHWDSGYKGLPFCTDHAGCLCQIPDATTPA